LTTLAGLGSRHREQPALGVAGPRLLTRVRRLLREDAMPRFAIARLVLVGGALGIVALSGVSVAGCAAGYVSPSGVTPAPDHAKTPTSDPFGAWIQFDTKGVEFGPWVRGFAARVKAHWIVPSEAMSNKGHVVLTFNAHKDGSITDLTLAEPSSLEAFNQAALSALTASNPLSALPPAYPAERAFFRVTFFYNEPETQTSQVPLK
jgi:TonB family protein